MSNLLSVLVKTVVLDDAAYEEWRARPNPLLRGTALIVVISLVAGLITFGINLVDRVKPVNIAQIETAMRESFDRSSRWNPTWQDMDPEIRQMVDEQMDVMVDMVADLVQIKTPLPRSVVGFFGALGAYLSQVPSALAGWMFYGALVLVAVNLLGGSAKLPDFLGMVSLYAIPGLLGLLGWIPCLGPLLGLVGLVWSIVIYVKATSTVSDLDIAKSILAVCAPAVIILALGFLLSILAVIWMAIVF